MTASGLSEHASPGGVLHHTRSPSIYSALCFAVLAWGGSFVAARLLLAPADSRQVALSPTVLATARFGLASLFFVVPLLRALILRQITPSDLIRMALLGQIAYSVYFWLQYTGVQQTNAGIASILVVGLIPLATAVASRLVNREVLSVSMVGALLLGLLGVTIVALQSGISLAGGSGFLLGSLCLVGNAIAFALYSTLSKRWMRSMSPLVMTSGTMIGGTLGLLILALSDPATNQWHVLLQLTPTQVAALLFLALICSVVAYLAYNAALRLLPAGRAAAFLYFEPVVAVSLGALLLNEHLSKPTLFGTALIALSVFFTQRSGSVL